MFRLPVLRHRQDEVLQTSESLRNQNERQAILREYQNKPTYSVSDSPTYYVKAIDLDNHMNSADQMLNKKSTVLRHRHGRSSQATNVATDEVFHTLGHFGSQNEREATKNRNVSASSYEVRLFKLPGRFIDNSRIDGKCTKKVFHLPVLKNFTLPSSNSIMTQCTATSGVKDYGTATTLGNDTKINTSRWSIPILKPSIKVKSELKSPRWNGDFIGTIKYTDIENSRRTDNTYWLIRFPHTNNSTVSKWCLVRKSSNGRVDQ